MHLDGARIWEAIAAQVEGREKLVKELKEYCACFDSVSLCFSKGLGAPIGSIIVGSQAFIHNARHKRKGLGGGLRQAGWISAPARVGVEETFLGGRLKASHDRARKIADMWVQRGGKLEFETESNMVWLDLGAAGFGANEDGEGCVKGGGNKRFVEMAVQRDLRLMGGRLVVHYRMFDSLLSDLSRLRLSSNPSTLLRVLSPHLTTQNHQQRDAVTVHYVRFLSSYKGPPCAVCYLSSYLPWRTHLTVP